MISVNKNNFIVEEIPQYNPVTQYYDRLSWWKEQKRRCIEGYWSGGRWMPGRLYFYINFWKIELKGSKKQKSMPIDRPHLRDVEWEKAYTVEEARGFSGFKNDSRYTCDHRYHPDVRQYYENLEEGHDEKIPKEDLIYETPRSYLRRLHSEDLGKPLYNNQAKNILEIGARGYGKSYFASGAIIAYNFMFDGATDYDEYLDLVKAGTPLSSSTIVGAIHSDYSGDLLKKFKVGYDMLPGSMEYNGEFYPSPLFKFWKGSLEPSKSIIAARDVKIGGNWTTKGSRSAVHHRTFKDNPRAAAGTRPSIVYLEEVGFMNNLTQAWGPLKDCTEVSMDKFGSIIAAGTGGAMESGATMEAQKIFYNPEAYDCLVFEDKWEGRDKISVFFPVTYVLNHHKDSNGNTNFEPARKEAMKEREKVKKSSDNQAYASELQNRPLYPSEAFLVTDTNEFPTSDLKSQLGEIESNRHKYTNAHFIGRFDIDPKSGEVEWVEDRTVDIVREFPVKNNDNKKGGIELFKKPKMDTDGSVPPNRYIAGCDPISDDSSETKSLASTFVMDLYTEEIVAEYTGRPNTADQYFENVYRLMRYYNAVCNYENIDKDMFIYFRNRGALHYLADTPASLRGVEITKPQAGNKQKGTHPTEAINRIAREYYKAWLMKQAYNRPEGVNNAMTLRSEALIKETIMWNKDGNFDRVSAIGMLMILKAEKEFYTKNEEAKKKIDDIKDDPFFKKYDRKVYGEMDPAFKTEPNIFKELKNRG